MKLTAIELLNVAMRAWFTTMNKYLDKLSVDVALAFQDVTTHHTL